MISNDAMEAALPLTHRLNDRGFFLRTKEGSPLARLASAARLDSLKRNATITQELDGDKPNLAPYVQNVTGIDEITRANLHDLCQEEILECSLRAVRAHLTIARTLVSPAVESLMSNVKARMTHTPPNELLNMNVTIQSEPGVMQNGTLISMIEKLRDASSVPPNLAMRLPAQTFEQVIELMKTGNSELDRDIEMWAKTQGDEVIMPIYNSLFRTENDRFRTFEEAQRDPQLGNDAMLVCFLLGRKLAEDAAIEGISMSKQALTDLALEYRNVAGQRLSFILDRQNRQAKQGLLVLSSTSNTIVVNQPVYKEWLAAGGCNEILFGLLLQPAMRYYIRDINEIADQCKTAWARHVAMQTAADSNARYSIAIRFLREAFVESLRPTGNGPDIDANLRAVQLAAFDVELAKVKPSDLDNLAIVCLKLVCRSCFADTDAESFLLKMVELQEQNPNLGVAEIATVAGMDYVTTWLASQLVLTT
jgi:hypothetical protein